MMMTAIAGIRTTKRIGPAPPPLALGVSPEKNKTFVISGILIHIISCSLSLQQRFCNRG